MSGRVTGDTVVTAGGALRDPTALQSLWASITAVIAKETRWRMRGRRAFAIVTIYLALLALLVFVVYQVMYDRALMGSTFDLEFRPSDLVSGSVSARIGQAIFSAILVVQMTLTMLLAPALTAGSISMEREKQTLELLITTPISTLGMVVGKLISSLAYVFLLIVASVPLMSIVFAFGGIAPDDVVRAYVLLFAVGFGIGSIGQFMSALLKRTGAATALSYLIVFVLTVGALILHTYWLASSRPMDRPAAAERSAPEAFLWLNPVIAVVDLGCTAIPDSYGFTCSYISTVTGQRLDPATPPRDAFWPRSAAAFLLLGTGLTLATTQLIAPSRRLRGQRPRAPDYLPAPDSRT